MSNQAKGAVAFLGLEGLARAAHSETGRGRGQ